MGFIFVIIIRVVFIACMVFILGYVFGGFSKKPALNVITKISAILLIVLFIAMNALFMRATFGHFHGRGSWYRCDSLHQWKDSSRAAAFTDYPRHR